MLNGATRLTYASANAWAVELERAARCAAILSPLAPAQPVWATPNQPIPLTDSLSLRRFGRGDRPGRGRRKPPVLIVTPQVNHSCIADFSADQSLVATLLGAGVEQVAVTDWLPPPRPDYSIADSIADLASAVATVGGKVHLVGLCQGGWQSLILAVLRPELVASLTMAAAPVDTHAGITPLHLFTFGLPMSFFQAVVAAGNGMAPGWALAAGFDLLRPFERFLYNPAMLYFKAHDEEFVRRFSRLRNWYRLNKEIAGTLYLETVRKLFKDNELARSRLEVAGRRVELAALHCPTTLVAGSRDHITPPAQLFALANLAPHANCRKLLIDAGHIGTFMGRRALATTWPELAADYH